MEMIIDMLAEASLNPSPIDREKLCEIEKRNELVILLGDRFDVYDEIRKYLRVPPSKEEQNKPPIEWKIPIPSRGGSSDAMLKALVDHNFLKFNAADQTYSYTYNHAREYLNGLWFEEYTYHAAYEAGADAMICGQEILSERPFGTKNKHKTDIDVVVRKSDKLLLISNKCKNVLSPKTEGYMYEQFLRQMASAASDLEDLRTFFPAPEKVKGLLAVTTDMVDEINDNRQRHPKLVDAIDKKKNVEIVGLDHMVWNDYVGYLQNLMNSY